MRRLPWARTWSSRRNLGSKAVVKRRALARACWGLTLRDLFGHRRRPAREHEAGAGPCTARASAAGAIKAFARGAQAGRAARGRGRVLPGVLAARHTRTHSTHAHKPAPALRHCRVGRLECAVRSRSRIQGHGSAKLLLITSICKGPTSSGVASRPPSLPPLPLPPSELVCKLRESSWKARG